MFSGKEYVYQVYKEKSFTKAAEKLYISQPSLSTTIKHIERKLGFQIFDRSTSPIQLTPYGEVYLQSILRILEVEHGFEDYLSDVQHLKTGSLRIGGTSLYTSCVLPPVIRSFQESHQGIDIDLTEENTVNLEQLLLSGELDCFLDNTIRNNEQFDSLIFNQEHLILAVPENFPVNQELSSFMLDFDSILFKRYLRDEIPSVPLDLFQDSAFILLKPENDTTKRGIKLCMEFGFEPHILFQLDQHATAYHIACSGMGIAFVSDILLRSTSFHPNVCYYKLGGKESIRNIILYYKKRKYQTFAFREFLNYMKKGAII